MSKTTKIIAALGVVAGLGVAALPAFTYATQQTVAGDVQLSVDVSEAIAMTIKGNEESTPAVDVFNPDNASTIDGHSGGTAYDSSKHQQSSSHTTLLPNAADTSTMTSEIKVYTNAAAGFTLTVNDADSTLALTGSNGGTIAAGTSITAGTANWAYKGGSVSNWAAITASPVEVYSQNAPTSGGATINMTYGVSTASDQPTGTYTDTIVYTATTNNGSAQQNTPTEEP